MIRFKKSISLLICGAALTSIVPVTSANAAVAELEIKEGTIHNAKAFANGIYIYMKAIKVKMQNMVHISAHLKEIF